MSSGEKTSSGTSTPEEDTLTIQGATAEKAVDFGDRPGVIAGGVGRGCAIKGARDITVQGDLEGVGGGFCTIEADGKVVVEGQVSFSRIQGREIVLEGDVGDSRLSSDLGISVRGHASRTTAAIGHRRIELRAIRDHAREHGELSTQLEELRVKSASNARRFVRDYPKVNLKMGDIFVPTRSELTVDLTTFYKAVKDGTPEKIDRALEEFYLKVVVGVLTRSNRDYIRRNPSRHKVFLKLIEDLRSHVTIVRRVDRLSSRVGELEQLVSMLTQEIGNGPQATFNVGGGMGGELTVQFLQYLTTGEASGSLEDLDRRVFEAKVVDGQAGQAIEIAYPDGKTSIHRPEGGFFERGSLAVDRGKVVWKEADS